MSYTALGPKNSPCCCEQAVPACPSSRACEAAAGTAHSPASTNAAARRQSLTLTPLPLGYCRSPPTMGRAKPEVNITSAARQPGNSAEIPYHEMR